MKMVDALKAAMLDDPSRARYLIDVSIEMQGVTEKETADLVALAMELGAIKGINEVFRT